MNSDTLVIHPTDPSTDFLKPIYSGKGYDLLTEYKGDLTPVLAQYKRVIMMGHGWSMGLFSLGRFGGQFAVDQRHLSVLEDKPNCYIWCKASDFVKAHGLKGFTTGMFISEVAEAGWFGIIVDQEEIDYSNNLFAEVMHRHVDNPDLAAIIKEYDGDSPVIQFNRAIMEQH